MNQQSNNIKNIPTTEKLAVIRIRGLVSVRKDIKKTLQFLRLYKRNYCVIVPKTDSYLGMINKVKDYVTWGEINDETFALLVEKRGIPYKGRETDRKGIIHYKKYLTINKKKIMPYFRLHPPKKGYDRKGIKKPIGVGGALGYRKEKINDLIKRMI